MRLTQPREVRFLTKGLLLADCRPLGQRVCGSRINRRKSASARQSGGRHVRKHNAKPKPYGLGW